MLTVFPTGSVTSGSVVSGSVISAVNVPSAWVWNTKSSFNVCSPKTVPAGMVTVCSALLVASVKAKLPAGTLS